MTGGDFKDHARSRFHGASMILYRPHKGELRQTRYSPTTLSSFKLMDGAWDRYFIDSGEWTRGLAAATLAGIPGAGLNFFFADLFPGQKALVTWANALIGGAAATAAIKSSRQVRFRARFNDATILEGRAEERQLTSRMPYIMNALIAARR